MPEATTVRDLTITPTEGGITAPKGFRSAALHCGIKAKANALDLAVIAADAPASAAGLFTTNLAQAAPVLVSKQHLARTRWRRASDRGEQRLRQRLHRRPGDVGCEAHGHRCGCGAGVRSERSARRIDRRDWRQSQDGSRLIRDQLVPSARSPAARAARPRAPS